MKELITNTTACKRNLGVLTGPATCVGAKKCKLTEERERK